VRYVYEVIASFANSATEKVWLRQRVSKWSPDVQRIAHRKLLMIDAADFLHDLRIPPGNRLEQLAGNRAGQHSIRVNDQWRICFTWTSAGAENIEIVDYH
jgi:proteic killer suppression protein